MTAVNTGLRQGELAALTWADIDFENKFINVNKTLAYQKLENDNSKTFHVGSPKTPSSVRKVPINRQAEIALKKQYLLRNNVWSRDCARINESCGDLVFATKLGGPINDQNVCDAIKRVLAVVNVFFGSCIYSDDNGFVYAHSMVYNMPAIKWILSDLVKNNSIDLFLFVC